MLHHVSFSVYDTNRAAALAAKLTCGRSIAAPTPPFPKAARFVLLGDTAGGMIELMPWGTVHSPVEKGLPTDREMRPFSASHVLVGTSHSSSEILSIARAEHLQATPVDTGLFQFVKVWIEDSFLLELLPAESARRYTDTFGHAGLPTVDGRLRQLEQHLVQQSGKSTSVS